MFRKCFMILCVLMSFASMSCFANEDDLSFSIAKIEGYKVYLKPGTVQVAKNGIFIKVSGQFRAINHLEIDEEGVYFDALRQTAYSDLCPACHLPLVFGFCMNPNCPSKG